MLSSVNVDELRHALGGVVLEAAYLERTLRTAFSALVGSKYAAVVRQLADQVADAADELRAAMTTALGTGWALIEDQLRQELGHEVRAEPGS
jgi:hypothetical protein